ncbi:MAG: type II secretion system minor pseudopilin GspH [Gammaproteobacteria bacterium]|nr:type II secretion system minor pseudopilin GspH [Gammaproteobacteria bacterium]NNJ85127.1 type II secretion system minor pseudopilin GspH [Gammaproteobacteria bacterium]
MNISRNRGTPHKTRCKCTGLTLFELLVVIAIIGIASTMIVVSFNLDDPDKNARIEAKRLANLIRLAIDESIITGSNTGLELTPDGYRFLHYEYGTGNRQALEAVGALRPRTLPESVSLELISLDGATLPSTDALHPRMVFLSSGEITPFQLSVINGYGKEDQRIIGKWDGSVVLETYND